VSSQEPRIDLAKITFPSDRLTIATLRELFPPLFDVPGKSVKYFEDERRQDLESMMEAERRTARRAFDAALGRTGSTLDQHEDRMFPSEQDREWLTELYVSHRLAAGPHHVEQLIRSIEQAAAEQAKGYGPPPL